LLVELRLVSSVNLISVDVISTMTHKMMPPSRMEAREPNADDLGENDNICHRHEQSPHGAAKTLRCC